MKALCEIKDIAAGNEDNHVTLLVERSGANSIQIKTQGFGQDQNDIVVELFDGKINILVWRGPSQQEPDVIPLLP